jgi:hypothetical protein
MADALHPQTLRAYWHEWRGLCPPTPVGLRLVVTSAGKTPSIFHESSSQTAGTFFRKSRGTWYGAFERDLYVPVQVPMMRTLLSAAIARKVQRFTVGKRFGIH